MITLALSLTGPLMLMLGIMFAAAIGAAGGYVLGTSMGRTPPETPLPTTVEVTRDRLSSVRSELEKASKKLTASRHAEAAGRAMVVSRRLGELSSSLGRIGRKARTEVDE